MKKVLCIVDCYNWALNNRAVALKSEYSEHNFEIKHFKDLGGIRFDDYDVVYSLNWPIHGYISGKISPRKNRKYRLVTGVSSHIGHPSDRGFSNLLSTYDGVGMSNKFLYKSFKKKFSNLKIFYTPFGVDCNTFYPKTDPSGLSSVFGWVGNPDRAVKRFAEIDKCVKSFEGKANLITATNRSNYSRSEMAEFYNRIGTLICFSESEGTPNPVLEAAACGRNIISTRVGNVPELFAEAGGIMGTNIVTGSGSLRSAIAETLAGKEKIKDNGFALSRVISKSWSWRTQALRFRGLLSL